MLGGAMTTESYMGGRMTTGAPSTVATATEGDTANITFILRYDIDYLYSVSKHSALVNHIRFLE